MGLAHTYRRLLHERALEQRGYITTVDAAELGVPASAPWPASADEAGI